MTRTPPARITLRALRGTPLADVSVRNVVVAAAHALAERHGFALLDVDAAPDRITCTIDADRTVALGFAAELRRGTNAWHEERTGGESLWGDAAE
ncbi:MAG TPA: hypothetical protein PKC43_03315 [Phycisphaerales bacterium]|mgnify:CR=1 FL=1|nr:hypothetical protein [Phycisphaerales bacterium]HMP36458.1 hypothetical protein [Phycisphaerales bacterium]